MIFANNYSKVSDVNIHMDTSDTFLTEYLLAILTVDHRPEGGHQYMNKV